MKTEEEHMGRSIPRRVVAAAVALFLAGITWYHCGGFGLRAVMIWLVCLILAAIAYTDFKTMRIPNRMTAALLIPAFLSLVTEPGITLLSRAMGGFAVSLPMYLMTLAVPESFGGGDIKLMAVCGLLLGGPRIIAAAFLSVVSGGGYAIWLLASHKAGRGSHFAFGPFLAAGVVLSLLYGDKLLAWYLGFLRG